MISKQIIRKEYLNIRKNIQDKKNKSNYIMQKLINKKEYQQANIIAIYNSLSNEVSTKELIKYSLDNDKIVVLPRVTNEKILFYKILSINEPMEISNFGIMEPQANINNLINSDIIDLVIVPGVCFDLHKNRVGYGKGYYDRFLENYHNAKIGLCFEEQILKEEYLEMYKTDIPMDCLITNESIYR